jgi:stage II sporulation protein D
MNKKTPGHWLLTLVLVLVFMAPTLSLAGQRVRILVLEGQREITVETATGTSYALRRSTGQRALVNGRSKRLPLEFRASPGDFVHINGRPYRGVLRVYAEGPGRGLLVVDDLDMEEYVAGLINYEISSAWPIEAVKAQAVAARTYVLYRMKRAAPGPYDIEGTTAGQVYRGAASEDNAATRAVRDCSGEVLVYGGEPALAVYHSNAGGRTDAAHDIWSGGDTYPYLRSVPSPYDRGSPRFRWDFGVPAKLLGRVLRAEGYDIGTPKSVVPTDLTPGGRVRRLRIRDGRGRTVVLRGEEMRKLIGYSLMRSSVFVVRREGSVFVFRGRGSGHGVGMSQWGARGMAEAGYSYREILGHYYPGARVKKVY